MELLAKGKENIQISKFNGRNQTISYQHHNIYMTFSPISTHYKEWNLTNQKTYADERPN